MKKIYFILLTVLFISCSKADDSSNSAIAFNPPAWMHGDWAHAGFEDEGPILRITSDDIILVVNTTEMSYKGQLELLAMSGAEVSADEVSTDNTYEVIFTLTQGLKETYSFTKIDASTISWNNSMDVELKKL